MKVVMDTNVLVSGLISPKGASAKFLRQKHLPSSPEISAISPLRQWARSEFYPLGNSWI